MREYRSPTTVTRTEDRSPEQLFPNEFHMSISSASGPWRPSKEFPTFEAQFANLRRILQELLEEDRAKKAKK